MTTASKLDTSSAMPMPGIAHAQLKTRVHAAVTLLEG